MAKRGSRLKIQHWAVFILAVGLMACAKDEGSSDSSSLLDPDDEEEVVLPPPSDSLMYVEAKRTTSLNFITHVRSDWSKRCTIDLSASLAERDIECTVEGAELDIFMNPINLLYNIPKHERCTHLEVQPYWFWSHEPGQGATAFKIRTLESGAVQLTDNGGGKVRMVGSTPSCIYDYSSGNGPNCCVGSYTVENTIVDPGGDVVQNETGSWGGTIGACAIGPGPDISGRAGAQALPRYTIYPLKVTSDSSGTAGQSSVMSYPLDAQIGKTTSIQDLITQAVTRSTGSIDVDSPFSKDYGSNVYSANYVENIGARPGALKAAPEVGASYGLAAIPKPYYEFRCVDDAKEVYARIRLQVREWNMMSEFEKGELGNPDISGAETEFGEFDLNDFGDWKDFKDDSREFPGEFL